jgi:hypothetical protein
LKRKTEISIETQRLVVLRRRPANSWCAACGEHAPSVTPHEAARLLGVSTRDIYRRIESGGVHFRESPGEEVSICSRSL